jgi:hypothetical protein
LPSSGSAKAPPPINIVLPLLELIAQNPGGHLDPKIRLAVRDAMQTYAESSDCDTDDVLFSIGSMIYGVPAIEPATQHLDPNAKPECIIDFDYMREFIEDVFLSCRSPLKTHRINWC